MLLIQLALGYGIGTTNALNIVVDGGGAISLAQSLQLVLSCEIRGECCQVETLSLQPCVS